MDRHIEPGFPIFGVLPRNLWLGFPSSGPELGVLLMKNISLSRVSFWNFLYAVFENWSRDFSHAVLFTVFFMMGVIDCYALFFSPCSECFLEGTCIITSDYGVVQRIV